jgi:hypothetical protein
MQDVLFDSAPKLGLGYDAPDVTAARIFALRFVTRDSVTAPEMLHQLLH